MINISVKEAKELPLVGKKVIFDSYMTNCLSAFRVDISRVELTVAGWKADDELSPGQISSVLLVETGSYHSVKMLELK